MTTSYNELLDYDNDYNLTGTILTIATDDEPCLLQRASSIPIDEIKSIEIQQLIIDMIETMKAAPGIGLAAPQIHQSLRIMVFYLPVARDDINCRGVPLTVLINPIIEPLDDQVTCDFEGCLSVPGFRGKVQRYHKIKYSGLNHRGEKIDQIAEGWHARLVQHEFDHLNGILYPTLMAEEDKLLTVDEWKQVTTTTVKRVSLSIGLFNDGVVVALELQDTDLYSHEVSAKGTLRLTTREGLLVWSQIKDL